MLTCLRKPNSGYSILWTVEWLDDQQRRLLTETSSTCQIADAQPFAPRDQYKGKKRKRNVDAPLAPTSSHTQDASPSENQNKPVQLELDVNLNDNFQIVGKEREHSPPGRRNSSSNPQKDEEVQTDMAETHDSDTRNDGPGSESMGNGRCRFFLLKPRTSTSRRVLIPLDPTATLAECLHGRTVLEFPTIYVFPASLEELSGEFMLEEEYLREEEGQQKEFDELMEELDPEILKRLREDGSTHSRETAEVLDKSQILDVLKKDFGTTL